MESKKTAYVLLGFLVILMSLAAMPASAQDATEMPTTFWAKDRVHRPMFRDVWKLTEDGTPTHLMSGMACPQTVGSYTRSMITIYAANGLDNSCSYDDRAGNRISLYFTRAEPSHMQKDFDAVKAALPAVMPGAVAIPDEEIRNSSDLGWKSALYEASGKRTGVWIANKYKWEIKFRATYAAKDQALTLEGIAQLTDALVRPAVQYLARCDAAQLPVRDGQAVLDEKTLLGQTLALLGAALRVTDAKDGVADMKYTWCVEAAKEVPQSVLILWRNIDSADSSVYVDRAVILGQASEQTFYLVTHHVPAFGWPAKRYYGVIIEDKDTLSLVKIFEGRPSVQDIIAVATAERMPTYAVTDKKTKAVTVYRPLPW